MGLVCPRCANHLHSSHTEKRSGRKSRYTTATPPIPNITSSRTTLTITPQPLPARPKAVQGLPVTPHLLHEAMKAPKRGFSASPNERAAVPLRHRLPRNGPRQLRFQQPHATTVHAPQIPSTPRHPSRSPSPTDSLLPGAHNRKTFPNCGERELLRRRSHSESQSTGFQDAQAWFPPLVASTSSTSN